jgi:uncharacterized cupredoxin-like copper-binding protein
VLAIVSGCLLAACGSDRPAADAVARSDSAPPPAGAAAVTITATDFTFDAPSEIPAGLTTFHLVNRGSELHHVQLVRLGEGKTADDLLAALKAGGPPPAWITMAGGPNPPEVGGTAATTVALEPGNYALTCFIPSPDGVPHLMKGMVRPLTVTAATASVAEPASDLTMKLLDFGFELDRPLSAGRHTIRVENAGGQPHEVAIVRLQPGKEPLDFAHWGEKQAGPAPGTLHGGVSAIMPGTRAFVEVDLQPGEYGLICFIPDMKDGKPHFVHGMVKRVTVS